MSQSSDPADRNQPLASVLSDPPSVELSLDDIMPDPLVANQRIFFDGDIIEFLYKEPHGPHVFFDTRERKPVYLKTVDIVRLKGEGRYVVPGGDSPRAPQVSRELADAERRYLQMSIGSVPKTPRKRAEVRFLYVGHFLSKIVDAEATGEVFAKTEENAALVVAEVDAIILEKNKDKKNAHEHIIMIPVRRQPRTVLAWLQRECEENLGPVGQVHKNSTLKHERKLPQEVFDIVAETIRAAIDFSGRFSLPPRRPNGGRESVQDRRFERYPFDPALAQPDGVREPRCGEAPAHQNARRQTSCPIARCWRSVRRPTSQYNPLYCGWHPSSWSASPISSVSP
jgi:hypothetical protein